MEKNDELKNIQRKIAELNAAFGRVSGDTPTILFADYSRQHMAKKLASPALRDTTKALFRNQIEKHLIPAFGALPLDQITGAAWNSWVSAMKAAGGPLTRFFMPRKCLIEVLNAAKKDGLIERMPEIENPDEPRSVGRALESREILAILWNSRRPFRFIFYVFFRMGCRPRELLKWEWSMIRFESPSLAIVSVPARISKTVRSREIPINSCVSRILWRRKARGNGSQFVFPKPGNPLQPHLSYDTAWRSACRRGGLAKTVPYDLRRSKITECAVDGTELIPVAKFLDTSVKLLETTYAKINSQHMRKIAK